MHAFLSCDYDRDQAIALAGTPQGRDLFLQGSEKFEAWFSFPASVGELLSMLMQLCGRDVLATLLEAIPQGADLIRIPARFNHWMLTTQMHRPPGDFTGLDILRQAAIEACMYRFTVKPEYLQAVRHCYTTSGFVRRPSPHSLLDPVLHHWLAGAMVIRDAQTYPPARFFAVTCQAALLDVPCAVAFCQSGCIDGTFAPPTIKTDMLAKTIELLESAPVWRPVWLFDRIAARTG